MSPITWQRDFPILGALVGPNGESYTLSQRQIAERAGLAMPIATRLLRLCELQLITRVRRSGSYYYTLSQPELGVGALLLCLDSIGTSAVLRAVVNALLACEDGATMSVAEILAAATGQRTDTSEKHKAELTDLLGRMCRAGMIVRKPSGEYCLAGPQLAIDLARRALARPGSTRRESAPNAVNDDQLGGGGSPKRSNLTRLIRAAKIFRALIDAPAGGLSAVDIAARTGLHEQIVRRGLRGLRKVDLVARIGDSPMHELRDAGWQLDALLPHLESLGASALVVGLIDALLEAAPGEWVPFEALRHDVATRFPYSSTDRQVLIRVVEALPAIGLVERAPADDSYRLPVGWSIRATLAL